MATFRNMGTWIALLMAAANVHAMTSAEFLESAMSKGIAKGVLTGDVADQLRKVTHSVEPTQATMERGEATADGCQVFKLTMTQPKVPKREGGFAGDYVTTTRITSCKDNRKPADPVVLDCTVGGVSCMPPR